MRTSFTLPVKFTASWRRLHRSYTVIVSVALAVLGAVYEHLPLFRALVSEVGFARVSMIVGVFIAVLRYVDQPCLRSQPPPIPDGQDADPGLDEGRQ